jgi:glycosyltransferase involved in cell wall biosynthesis
VLNNILFGFFVCCILVQCCYYLYFLLSSFADRKKKGEIIYNTEKPVSIVICARNEAANLKNNLPIVLDQNYFLKISSSPGVFLKPNFEVIVVNDGSDDETETVLFQLEQQYSNLWHVTISKDTERTFKGKKFALSYGVRYATHPALLLTDADCFPASSNWLSKMVQPLYEGKEIVAGYGAYLPAGGFVNLFTRWETIHTFMQYSSFALSGKPYMAVGRNLACTKEVFQRAEKSEVWNELPSGDDDLLMRCCATATNSAIVSDIEAFTYSGTETRLPKWIKQKQRHLSTGKYYRDDIKALVAGYAVSHFLSWLMFMLFILLNTDSRLVYSLMGFRCLFSWIVIGIRSVQLNDSKLLLFVPFGDPLWAIYNFVLSPFILWKNKMQWK